MQTGLGDDNRFRQGASLTIGLCYLQVLAYFKNISIEFAVFVSGVAYVTTRLVAFMVCLLIVVTAFSQMFETIFLQSSECDLYKETQENTATTTSDQDFVYMDDATSNLVVEELEDCEPSIDAPYCSGLYWAWYKTYTMMLGEIDDTLFYWNGLSLILFCLFYFFVVILLLNILIAIITDFYRVITNDRAAIVFWSNRLAFIVDMDLVTNGPWKKAVMNFFRLGKEDEVENSKIEKDKVEITWERLLWMKLIETFDPEMDKQQGARLFFYFPLRIFFSFFLIPFWLMLGILSAGWLWPPQVREGLFVQAVSIPADSGEIREVEKRVEEVMDLRKDIGLAQSGMIKEFEHDRKNMSDLKNQVKEIKKELKKEMKNIKQVMKSLFEVQQQGMMS